VRAILIASLFALGCGNSPHPGAAEVTLGTTALDGSGFYPLAGDQPLVPGAQGGYHVWLKYRVQGMAPGSVRVTRTARRVSDDRLLLTTEGTEELGPADEATGYWELPRALPSFMCPTPIGVQVRDEAVHFEVVVKNADGTLLGTGDAEATPRCADGDQHCIQICSG
jgi:hypothetical protein